MCAPNALVIVKRSTRLLTFHREVHGLADVRAHIVADLAQVVAAVFFHHVLDQQRPVAEDLNSAIQGNGLELGNPSTWDRTEGGKVMSTAVHTGRQ